VQLGSPVSYYKAWTAEFYRSTGRGSTFSKCDLRLDFQQSASTAWRSALVRYRVSRPACRAVSSVIRDRLLPCFWGDWPRRKVLKLPFALRMR